MPIYQYKCADCEHQLEALQKMSDAKLRDCPSCGAPALVKQVTAASFKLKGTGWYETDFKNSGKPTKPAAKDSQSDAGSDSKSGSDSVAAKPKSANSSEGSSSSDSASA